MAKGQYMPDKIRRPRHELIQAVMQIEGVSDQYKVAGSWRREKETVGDLDVVVGPGEDFGDAVDWFKHMFGYEEIRGGALKSEGVSRSRNKPLNINLWRVANQRGWGGMMLYATGPHDLNIYMRAKAQGKGWILNQYGLFDVRDRKCAGETLKGGKYQLDIGVFEEPVIASDLETLEKDIFDKLGIQYLTPVERETWRNYLIPTKRTVDFGRVISISSSRPGHAPHQVRLEWDGYLHKWIAVECECEHFTYRKRQCRHMREAEAKAAKEWSGPVTA